MKKKNLTLIFRDFGEEHLGKDVFLVPYYLGKRLGYKTTIVYPLTENNKNLPSQIRGVNLIPLKSKGTDSLLYFKIASFKYLIRNARQIDLLMQIHWGKYIAIMAFIYKFLNHKGKSYIKLDSNNDALFRKHSYLKFVANYVDIFTCEVMQAYRDILGNRSYSSVLKDKLILMPNGVDEEYLQGIGLSERSFEEKENLIITVGRLGCAQKNTNMLLRALKKVDLKGWRVCLIGPVDESFGHEINAFYKEYPDKMDTVLFTGSIYNKKELWEYYNRAKVFVLTSRWEGSPIVYPEAMRFRNYLISTPMNALKDLYDNGRLGVSVAQDADCELAEQLNEIISGKRNTNVYNDNDVTSLSWERMVEKIKI